MAEKHGELWQKGCEGIFNWEKIGRVLQETGRLGAEIFFPRSCHVCGTEIDEGVFCPACRQGLWAGRENFPGKPLASVKMLFVYDQGVKTAIRKIKFESDRYLAESLAEEAALALSRWPLLGAGLEPKTGMHVQTGRYAQTELLLCGIPTDAERRRKRGFDLPELLFKRPAEAGGLRWQTVLERCRPTKPLYALSPTQRRLNLAGCFRVCGDVCGKTIILADDIFTTGATMKEAALTLKRAGARCVGGLAFAGARANLDPER